VRASGAWPSFVAGLLVLVAALAVSRSSWAHTIGLSSGEYTARGTSLVARLSFARAEVASLAPALDANRDGHVTALELEAGRGLVREKLLRKIEVTAGGAPCTVSLTDAGLTEQDGMLLGARWDCPGPGAFEVDVRLLDDLARGHRHVARAVSGALVHDEVLSGEHRAFTVPADAETAAPPATGQTERRPGLFAFVWMGIEHILTGYDHLVFVCGLVLARARARSLVAVVTAFTVAHSITLAVAALGVWAPSPRIVEPAIALSIAYVGIENLFVKDAARRWRITFPFGLVHGFGFAGALREAGIARSAVPGALVGFNVGVELGQLACLAVLLPLVARLRRTTWFEPQGYRAASLAIAALGVVWFVARIV